MVKLLHLSNLSISKLRSLGYNHVEAVGDVANVLSAGERCLFAIVKPAIHHLVVLALVVSEIGKILGVSLALLLVDAVLHKCDALRLGPVGTCSECSNGTGSQHNAFN